MNSSELNPKKVKRGTGTLVEKATDPHQYDSLDLDWKKEGMLDSPTRQFFCEYLEKNLYNEKTLEYKKTVTVSRKYPYPYGFILDTTSGDGDKLDVFVVTNKNLKSGQVVECEPIGLMEQIETTWDQSKKNVEEEDHNVLAVFPNEYTVIDDHVRDTLRDFALHVFDHLPDKKVRVGDFLDKEAALRYIEKCKDK